MKKITLFIVLFLPFVFYAQQCPPPMADADQYFCSVDSPTLNDMTVPGSVVLTWYDDSLGTNTLPGNTPLVDGTTYYVSNTDPGNCTESNLVPVTAHVFSAPPSDPVADPVQYFCKGTFPTLNDIAVTHTGNLTWYDDALKTNTLPGTHVIVHGETYYVSATDLGGCYESNLVPIKTYKQSVHFGVSPASCIYLGENVYLVDPADTVKIELFDINNNPVTAKWTPLGSPLYIDPGLVNPNFNFYFDTMYFGNALPDRKYEFTVETGNGGACPSGKQKITIYTGRYIYDDFCYGATTTLADILFPSGNPAVAWFDDAQGLNPLPGATILQGDTLYYADLGTPGCTDLLPVEVRYKVGAPSGVGSQSFCTPATWTSVGISQPDDTLNDLKVCGQNLKWYDSTKNLIANPGGVILTNGAEYYVTQTVGGCEGRPLKIKVNATTCGCLEDAYTFRRRPLSSGNFQSCNERNIPGPISLGPVNGTGPTDFVVRTTPGPDPIVPSLTRTSPWASCGTDSFRLNNTATGSSSGSGAVALRKRFIAADVLTFDFALILQDPGHAVNDQPFFVVNIYDNTGALFTTRCVISDTQHCLFNVTSSGSSTIVYSNWSCLKFNTVELKGKLATMEVISGDCNLSGHWAYTYFDNLYVGEDKGTCESSIFGYLALDPIDAQTSPELAGCSFADQATAGACDPALPVLNPVFPFDICGNFSDPISAPGKNPPAKNPINIKIYKNGSQVGSTSTLSNSTLSTFCFEVDYPRDFSGSPVPRLYGYYTFEASTKYDLNCGKPMEFNLSAKSNGFKVCPAALCPTPITGCTNDPPGSTLNLDLTTKNADISANYDPALNETTVTYYTTLGDARGKTNPIANPSAYPVVTPITAASNTFVYARLDFNWSALNAGPEPEKCFDVVPLQIIAGAAPDVPATLNPIEVCADPSITDYVFDLTVNEGDLLVNITDPTDYEWGYYETLTDAQFGNPADEIVDPINYTATIGPGQVQTIYIRTEGADGCFAITTFDLEIFPEIVFTAPTDYELCDDSTPDGSTNFDLNVKVTQMTNNNPDYDVTFYDNQADADSGIATPLPLSYTNTTTPETIYVRIEDQNDCYVTTSFDLIVNPLPVAGLVTDMVLCDVNNTGTGQFDLSIPEGEILNGQANMVVDFYNSQANADAGGTTGKLSSPYTNTSNPQTIYFRIEDTTTLCYDTGSLKLEVLDAPPITPTITDYKLCDNDQLGAVDFDLTTKRNEILNTIPPATVTVTYYNSLADATAPANPIGTPTAYSSAGNETIYFRVEYNNAAGCFAVGQFKLMIYDQVAFNPPAPLIVCDTGSGTGMAPFDLSKATTQITGNDPNLSVTYYLTEAQAKTGNPGDRLSSPYTNTVPDFQTIYVRIKNQTTGCYAVAPLDLQVNDAPTANEPAPLTYCDEDNDGLGSFILTDADAEITGGDPNLTVSYHVTYANASNNVLPLASPFYNTVLYSQIIYARVESPGVACFSIVEVELKVLDSPQLKKPDDLVACDLNQNGTGQFDLTQVETKLMSRISNPANFIIKYYANATDLANDDAIVAPTSYTSVTNPQTIYVVVEDAVNGCKSQEEFEIHVADMPQLFHPDPLELCDINKPNDGIEQFNLGLATNQITGGDTSITITYHATQAAADNGTPVLPNLYTNQVNNQTIYIRAQSSDGCVISEGYTLTLIVNPLPSPKVPDPLEVCDPSSDGFSVFNLEDATQQIRNNEPNTVVTYHQTLSDAKLGVFPLASPYANIVAYQQTIYARSEFTTTGCFNTVPLDLIVHDTPDVPVTLPDIVVCSEDQTDIGIIFDLTVNDSLIYGLQNPQDFKLTYHETQQDAIDNVRPIVDPENYANTSNPQDIWIRLGDKNTECGTVRKVTLKVELAPEIGGPFELQLCADGETTEFDLTVMNQDFNIGAKGLEVRYYKSESDARGDKNHIDPANAYTNTTNPQTLYVRLMKGDTGCAAYSTLTLVVNPNPDIVTPEPIAMCDVDETGYVEFDLTIREAEILNGETGTFSYHLTRRDADNNLSPILNPDQYTNVETPEQTIYVRVTNDVTGCYSVVELLLIVNPLPVLEDDISDYIICEVKNNGHATFDLTTKIPEILGNQDPLFYVVKFYEDQLDAENGVDAIVNPRNFVNSTNPQEIFVRVENIDSECFVTGKSFFLRVLDGAEAFPPAEILETCEDEVGTGIGTFDLTQLDVEILGGQDPAIYKVTYYENPFDADAGTNAIPDPANYQGPAGTIYARVTNINSDCYEVVEVKLDVILLPIASLEDTYRLCIDADGNAIMEETGEPSPPILDTGLGNDGYVFIWKLNGDLLLGETSSTLNVKRGGQYSVTIVDMLTGCEFTLTTTVTVSSPPIDYSAEVVTLPFANPHTIEATASGYGTYVFQLDNGPAQSSGIFTEVTPGQHIITITDINGCGSVSIPVKAIDYPMFFTPNGDGYHDTWHIIGIESIKNAKLYIFDRYGKLLKQLSPTSAGWDGTFNGNPMPSSDYWFQLIYAEDGVEKEFKGHFTLKR